MKLHELCWSIIAISVILTAYLAYKLKSTYCIWVFIIGCVVALIFYLITEEDDEENNEKPG